MSCYVRHVELLTSTPGSIDNETRLLMKDSRRWIEICKTRRWPPRTLRQLSSPDQDNVNVGFGCESFHQRSLRVRIGKIAQRLVTGGS
jgi:hypothetical protein